MRLIFVHLLGNIRNGMVYTIRTSGRSKCLGTINSNAEYGRIMTNLLLHMVIC